MPRYDYKCPKCKAFQVVVHDFHASDTYECAECGDLMERVISAPAVIFRGSGFYKTDNGSK